MCKIIEIVATAAGRVSVMPTDCDDVGTGCRLLSAPYRDALGIAVSDVDVLGGRSHVVAVDVEIKDLDALERAAQKIGMRLARGQTTHRWYGRWVNDYHSENAAYRNGVDPKDYGKCEHALVIPGDASAYEVGVIKNRQGAGFKLIFDFYGTQGQKVQRLVGENADSLRQAYGTEVVRGVAARQRHRVLSEVRDGATGDVRLRIEVPRTG